MGERRQVELFAGADGPAPVVAPAEVPDEVAALRVPPGLRFGTSTWSFPGWAGIVYAGKPRKEKLARYGLAAYARHPLLGCVGVDRSYYAPLTADDYAEFARAVPAGFRFVVKAHDACTVPVYPDLARHGKRRGRANPRFLDPGYAAEIVEGMVSGLRDRLGAVLFQFSSLDPRLVGGPERFAARLGELLRGLPAGPTVAVELRNPELLTDAYAAALAEAGACHCVNVYPGMPGVLEQYERTRATYGPALVLRWMLAAGMTYEQAHAAHAPFDRLVDEDPATRRAVGRLCQRALRALQPGLVIVNNNAEGCAPRSIARLLAWMEKNPD